MEEALIEMYLAGVSVRRVEDITEALWGTKVSPATLSDLNKKMYQHIEAWRNRPSRGIPGGLVLKRSALVDVTLFATISLISLRFGRQLIRSELGCEILVGCIHVQGLAVILHKR